MATAIRPKDVLYGKRSFNILDIDDADADLIDDDLGYPNDNAFEGPMSYADIANLTPAHAAGPSHREVASRARLF